MGILLGISQAAKPSLGVYYESLCPYSRQFIREEVWPAYEVLAEYFDVDFVAYGNARVGTYLKVSRLKDFV
jgi:interferon gamma-inducible protein 30